MASSANVLHALLNRGFDGALSDNSVEEDNVGIERKPAWSEAEILRKMILRRYGGLSSHTDAHESEAGAESQNQISPRAVLNGTRIPTPPPNPLYKFSDTSDVRSVAEELSSSEYQLCESCQSITIDKMRRPDTFSDIGGSSTNNFDGGYMLHKTWAHLIMSWVQGCHLCRFFWCVCKSETKKDPKLRIDLASPVQLRVRGSDFCWEFLVGSGSYTVKLGAYVQPDYGAASKLPVHGRKVENDPTSETAINFVLSLIDDCCRRDKECALNRDVLLPPRVIDMGPLGSPYEMRLLVTQKQTGAYVALSHRWGSGPNNDNKVLYRCTTENFDQLQMGFDTSFLPRTFRNAVVVAKKLGYRYLWVDALCIVQDSPSDWDTQSALMSSIYGNSHLTISAMSASSSDEGFLECRDPLRYIATRFLAIPQAPDQFINLRYPRDELPKIALASRAWVLQELVLPPRVVHYTSSQIVFQCNVHTSTEDGGDSSLGFSTSCKSLLHSNLSEFDPGCQRWARWYSLVEEYSRRELTVETDKLPAIAGVADMIQNATDGTYLAGLWKEDLINGLLWIPSKDNLTPTSTYIAPFWSWASMKGPIIYQSGIYERREFGAHSLEVLEVNVNLRAGNRLGRVTSAKLRVAGYLRPLECSRIGGRDAFNETRSNYFSFPIEDEMVPDWLPRNVVQVVYYDNEDAYQIPLDDPRHLATSQPRVLFQARFDTGEVPDENILWCLSFVSPRNINAKPRGKHYAWGNINPDGLILSSINADEKLYKRVGVFSMRDMDYLEKGVYGASYADCIFHAGAQRKEIVLV